MVACDMRSGERRGGVSPVATSTALVEVWV